MASNGNKQDATPTWSGFNYQGKMGLLCIMEHMNEALKDGRELEDMFFEFEKNEDLVVYYNTAPIALYQMKAYLYTAKNTNKTAISKYTEACEKLETNKENLMERLHIQTHPDLYLVTPLEIQKWDNEDNRFRGVIELFKYQGKHVGVLDVKECIESEIEVYANLVANSEQGTLLGVSYGEYYLALCDFLDQKISLFHVLGKQSNYKISFREISKLFLQVNNSQINLQNAKIKETIFKEINSAIYDNIFVYCEECGDADCTTCSILQFKEHILKIDLKKYIELLNPDKMGWNQDTKYLRYFDDRNFEPLILDLIYKHDQSELFCRKDNIELKNLLPGGLGKLEAIIPTFISHFNHGEEKRKRSLQMTMQNISRNVDIHSRINNHILSASIGLSESDTFSFDKDSITYFPDLSQQFDHDEVASNCRLKTVIVDVNQIQESVSGGV